MHIVITFPLVPVRGGFGPYIFIRAHDFQSFCSVPRIVQVLSAGVINLPEMSNIELSGMGGVEVPEGPPEPLNAAFTDAEFTEALQNYDETVEVRSELLFCGMEN
jgi:hypothetical protein